MGPFLPTTVAVLMATTVADTRRDPVVIEKACEAGSAADCFNLAFMHEYGEVEKVGCDGGVVGGPDCHFPDLLYLTGGVPKDLARAVGYYERACQGAVPQGCVNAGVLYDVGAGGPRSPGRAAELFRRACEGGVAAGCSNLAVMYERGEGVEMDPVHAAELFRKGCEGQTSNGCKGLRRIQGIELRGAPAFLAVPSAGDFQKPVRTKYVPPQSPPEANCSGAQVGLQCQLSPQGRIQGCAVLKSVSPACDGAAVAAVKRWEYKPAILNGVPREARMPIEVKFGSR